MSRLGEFQPPDIPNECEAAWPLIELGAGLIEVAEGYQEGAPALIFGKNGTGTLGEPTQPDRAHLPGETLAVITFANVESLDVVAGKLATIRAKLAAQSRGVPRFPKTYCSQCGGEFGPGSEGYSSCRDHFTRRVS